tara:strand:- start:2019 stop:2309 length:291 start_codon:yes stop_codon:yes gene_type:complete
MLRIISFLSISIFLLINIYHYNVSYEVIKKEKTNYEIERQILNEKQYEAQLKTEWAIITSPKNLEKLADKYSKNLKLKPVNGNQIQISPHKNHEEN